MFSYHNGDGPSLASDHAVKEKSGGNESGRWTPETKQEITTTCLSSLLHTHNCMQTQHGCALPGETEIDE